MLIGMVSPYDLGVPGGVQGQVRGLAIEMTRRGHEVIVVSPGGAADDPLVETGVRHIPAGATAKISANGSKAPLTLSLRAARATALAFERSGVEVVHLHEPLTPVEGWAVLRRHRAPIVGTFHRSGVDGLYRGAGLVLRGLIKSIDVAVAVSPAAAQTARSTCGLDPQVLFNGIDVEAYRTARPWPKENPTALFLGRDEKRKGRQVLLDAARLLDPSVTIWATGDPPPTESSDSGAKIHYLGQVSEAEKRERLAAADVLCAPSLGGESFGLVLLEGLAAGAVVVASDIDGYREALNGHGFLVRPDDPEALAIGIRSALDQGRGGTLASKNHVEKWSMAALADRYELIYRDAQRIGQVWSRR